MTATSQDQQERWASWTPFFIDRLPLPYPLTVGLATAFLLGEQLWEYSLRDPDLGGLAKVAELTALLAIPLVFLYCVIMIKVLRGTALRELAELQASLDLTPTEYDGYVHRMVSTSRRGEGAIGVASVAIVVVLWVILGLPLPVGADTYLPHQPLAALVVLASYVLFCWGGLSLIYATLRFGASLGALARCPLTINIFDPENLLPFGRLSLLHSLSAAGVILILLISLGPPVSFLAWSVVLLATLASLSALIWPLRGVNRQMSLAKRKALAQIHGEFLECQNRLLQSVGADDVQLKAIADRVETLGRLRKTVAGAAAWPFRDLGAALRALIAALSPLVYVVVSEAIRTYLSAAIQMQP